MSLITIRDPQNPPASRYSISTSDQRWTRPRLLLSGLCDGEVTFGGGPAEPLSENGVLVELRNFTILHSFVHIRHGIGVLRSSLLIFLFLLLSYIILAFYSVPRGILCISGR